MSRVTIIFLRSAFICMLSWLEGCQNESSSNLIGARQMVEPLCCWAVLSALPSCLRRACTRIRAYHLDATVLLYRDSRQAPSDAVIRGTVRQRNPRLRMLRSRPVEVDENGKTLSLQWRCRCKSFVRSSSSSTRERERRTRPHRSVLTSSTVAITTPASEIRNFKNFRAMVNASTLGRMLRFRIGRKASPSCAGPARRRRTTTSGSNIGCAESQCNLGLTEAATAFPW
jgi:hypothetical protein